MPQVQPTTSESVKNERAVLRQQHLAQTPIDHCLGSAGNGVAPFLLSGYEVHCCPSFHTGLRCGL